MRYINTVQLLDAVEILKKDHRRLWQLFVDFLAAKSEARQLDLMPIICNSVKLHLALEAEVFLPSYVAATRDHPTMTAAATEREMIEEKIEELEYPDPGGYGFFEEFYGLKDLMFNHIATAETPAGIFARASHCNMDGKTLGYRLRAWKQQLRARRQESNPVCSEASG
jgi:hypothetical protein